MAGTSKGAKKAASTRKQEDSKSFQKMGASKGGKSSHSGTSSKRK